MRSDPRDVVGRSENGSDGSARLQEQLDREVLPCLERPGQWLGPWIPGREGRRDGAATVALWWPSPVPRPSLPEPLEALAHRFSDPSPYRLALVTTPGSDLLFELERRGLPLFSRPRAVRLREHPWHLIWLDEPLQILDLLTLEAGGAGELEGPDRPVLLAAGPAVAPLGGLLDPLADLRLGEEDLPRLVDGLLAHARGNGDGPPLQSPELRSWVADYARAHGLEWWEGDFRPGERASDRPKGRQALRASQLAPRALSRRRDLSRFGVRDVEIGVGGRRLDLHLFSASHARRESLGLPAADGLAQELCSALEDPFLPLRVHLTLDLPGETASDRAAIAELFAQLRAAAGPERRLEAEVSLYVPDAGELGRAAAPAPPARVASWLEELRRAARKEKVRLHEPAPGSAWVTALLEHGGDGLAPVLRAVHAAGALTGESGLATDADLWHKSMQAVDFGDPPWGVGPSREPEDAGPAPERSAPTGLEELPRRRRPEPKAEPRAVTRPRGRAADRWQRWQAMVPRRFDYRVEYRVLGRTKFLSQGELGGLLARRCEQCDLPLATTGVVQPKLRMSFGPALPVGIEGLQEYVDLGLTRKVAGLRAKLAEGMPDGIEIVSVRFIPPGQPRLGLSRVARADYEVPLDLSTQETIDVHETLSRRVDELRSRLGDDSRDGSDLHHQVCDVRLSTDGNAAAWLAFSLDLQDPGTKRKPHDLLELLLGDLVEDVRYLPIRRTRLLVRDDTRGGAIWRTPSEMVVETTRRIRDAEKIRA